MLTLTIIIHVLALIGLGVAWSLPNPRDHERALLHAAPAASGPLAALRARVVSIVAACGASASLRAPAHPLVETMNVRHDRIIGGLRHLANVWRRPDPDAINAAWDDIAAEVRDMCAAVLNLDAATEAHSAALANLAAQYLDLALWMDTTRPDAYRTPEDTLVVSHEWQDSMLESTGPLWVSLSSLSSEAHRIATAGLAARTR